MPRRFALVIGNAAYVHAGELGNPRNDASAIADVLKEMDFKVALGKDLRIQEMEDILNRFEVDIYEADTALFFFAGHGIQVKGQNYLIPIDAEIKQEIHLRRRTFSLTEILGTMEQNAQNTLIFLDACRDNPFTRSYLANVRAEERARSLVRSGLAGITLEANRSSFIAYATSPDTVAFDGTGLHSPFTQGLLEHIRTPNISISDMMIEVRKAVLKATNNRQRPWDQSALQERFCFKLADAVAKLPHAEDKPTQPKGNLSDEGVLNAVALEHWRAIKGAADPRKLRDFLAEFGAAKVSWLARDRLKELEAAAWSRLPATRTENELRAFLADYPDGVNAPVATAELTALLAAPEKTYQKGTLAEAGADPQQSEAECAQPTQASAARQEEERRQQGTVREGQLIEGAGEVERMYAQRRKVIGFIAAAVAAVFFLTYLISSWPQQRAPTISEPLTLQPPALANTKAPATPANVTATSPLDPKPQEELQRRANEARQKIELQDYASVLAECGGCQGDPVRLGLPQSCRVRCVNAEKTWNDYQAEQKRAMEEVAKRLRP